MKRGIVCKLTQNRNMNSTKRNFITLAAAGWVTAFAGFAQAQPYYVAGDFNLWNASSNQMTGGPTVYDFVITNGTAGNYQQFQITDGSFAAGHYWPGGHVWVKADAGGSNTVHFIPGVASDGWLPVQNRVGYDDPGNMAWEVTGDFTTPQWGSDPNAQMTSSGNGLYSVSYTLPSPGTHQYKFRTPGTWNEANFGVDIGNGSGNSSFDTAVSNQVVTFQLDLPSGRWLAGSPVTYVTNDVVFLVDMSIEETLGRFDPSVDQVFVSGAFNNWPGVGTGALALTNDPPWNGNTNIYYATNRFVGAASSLGSEYKFTDTDPALSGSSQYEPLANNRSFNLLSSGGTEILPVAVFGNSRVSDYLPNDVTVTFTIDMTGATSSTNLTPPIDPSHAFVPGTDTVYINGNFLDGGWISSWNPLSLSANAMTQVGSSSIYTFTYTVPKGNPVEVHYKYAMNWPGNDTNLDNEAPAFQDKIRYIRVTSTGTYSMPQDTFNSYDITGTNYTEPSFGELAVKPASAGLVTLSWLGRPGVHVQTTPALGGGSWTDLYPTDGTNWTAVSASPNGSVSSTNWPVASGNVFFRLLYQ
jgi:hypothetical protein